MYTIRIGQKDYPCKDKEMLQALVNQGKIPPTVHVYDHTAKEWKTATTVLQPVPAPVEVIKEDALTPEHNDRRPENQSQVKSKDASSPTPSAGGAKKSRIPLVIAGSAVLVIMIAAFSGFSYWKLTPAYAFNQIKTAIQTHDRELFHEYVDVDTMVKRGVDVLIKEAMNEEGLNDGDNPGKNLAEGLAGLITQRMVESFRDEINTLIETTHPVAEETNEKAPQKGSVKTPLNLRNIQLSEIQEVIQQDKISIAVATGHNRKFDASFPVRLKFREVSGGHLSLIEIENLGEIVKLTNDAERKWKIAKNRPVRQRLSGLLKLTGFRKENKTDKWDINRKIVHTLRVMNLTDMELKNLILDVNLLDKEGKNIVSLPFAIKSGSIVAKAEMEIDFDMKIFKYKDIHKFLWALDYSTVSTTLTVKRAELSTGEILEIPYPDVEED